MSRIGVQFPRTTLQLTTGQLLSTLQRTQADLARVQSAISSGQELIRPSDRPSRTSVVLILQNQLQARQQHERNLQHATGLLNFIDQSFNDTSGDLIEARSIASSQVSIGSNPDTRRAESAVIDAILDGILNVANQQYQGISLFGGERGTALNQPVFEDFLGGVRYLGAETDLTADLGLGSPLGVNSNGADAFGALSSRVLSDTDLDPQATAATHIVDVNGVLNQGIRPGTITIDVDGTPLNLDLAQIDTLGDVVTRVNDAIDSIDPTAGSLAIAGSGFDLTANAGHTITITNLGADQAAADLGIALSATGATVAGADIDPRLTRLTELAALGVPVDFASGLKITQGAESAMADFSTATTVEDLINEIDGLRLGLRLQINGTGTGLDLRSEVSGLDLSIGENAGGTTATDLGMRSYATTTRLEVLRFGLGVEIQNGEDDFVVELHDGTSFNVNLDGAVTIDDVLIAVSAAATGAGLTVGAPGSGATQFNLGLAQDGNGLQFEDNTVGGGDFRFGQLGLSLAGSHLGLVKNAGAGGTIVGDDVAQVRVESVITHLMQLRDALDTDDSSGITLAGEKVERDIERLASVRAGVGVRSRRVEQQQRRSEELKTTEQTMLSEIRDADLTEMITRFVQLQQQLQASLQVGSQNLQLSFLDFLR
jgi:flagellar hook-associated protein 3 FlgL